MQSSPAPKPQLMDRGTARQPRKRPALLGMELPAFLFEVFDDSSEGDPSRGQKLDSLGQDHRIQTQKFPSPWQEGKKARSHQVH